MPHVPLRRASAFTLIELMTVIGIISLLVALLLPALRNTRRAAWIAQCSSQLHQLGQAYRNREVDVNSKQVDRMQAFGWPGALSEYIDRQGSMYICPEDENLNAGARRGIDGLVLQVFRPWTGDEHIYDMALIAEQWTLRVDPTGTPSGVLNTPKPPIDQAELDEMEEGSYRLYFEDLRPHGGDQDFRDVVLEILETPDGNTKITYIQDAAGYYFNLATADGEILWERMDNGGITKPGAVVFVDGQLGSYGMNDYVRRFHTSNENLILLLDYESSVADPIDDDWTDWHDERGVPYFARHFDKANVLFRDGGVRATMDPALFDPTLSTNLDLYWEPD